MGKNNVLCTSCGYSLQTQTGVKLVAGFQIICSSLLLLFVGFLLVQQGSKVINSSSCSRTSNNNGTSGNVSIGHNVTVKDGPISPDTTFRMFVAYLIIFVIVGILLLADVGLLNGANQRIVGKCSMWCSIRYIRSVFAGIIFIAGFYKSQIQPLKSFVGVEIILNLCCVIIVQKFIRELTSDEGDKDWRQSSINSNASTSSDTPWFTSASISSTSTTTTPSPLDDEVFHFDEGVSVDKQNEKRGSNGKTKSVTFA